MLQGTEPDPQTAGWLMPWLPFLIALVVVPLLQAFIWRLVKKERKVGGKDSKEKVRKRSQFKKDVWLLAVLGLGVLVLVMALPGQATGIEPKDKVQFVGLLLSLLIALSSQTLLGNAMAGLMVRSVDKVHPGDWVRIESYFGKVTEMGLMHTEIQTEDRDLMTVPNLFLVNRPVKVIRSSGTLLSASVSLGYEVPHQQVKDILKKAVEETGLESASVQITALGDFAVTYNVAGLLKDPEHPLSKRSSLHVHVLDALHEAHIEIVSPNVVMTRIVPENQRILPEPDAVVSETPAPDVEEPPIDSVVFDKGMDVDNLETQRKRLAELAESIEQWKQEAKDAESDRARERLERHIQAAQNESERLESSIEELTERLEDAE